MIIIKKIFYDIYSWWKLCKMQTYGLCGGMPCRLFLWGWKYARNFHPDECIDCGVCEPECPVEAIHLDTEDNMEKWVEMK